MSLIPEYVFKVAEKLEDNEFHAYLVGGSLRDILSYRTPKDYDIATKATPEEVIKIFPRSIPTGAKYGTIIVLVEDDQGETQNVEVTTYRSEKDYVGGRWPSHVEFTKNIVDDLERRDFTVNAMALKLDDDLKKHIDDLTPEKLLKSKELMDPFNGKKDLDVKLIKAVGDPVIRFQEDGLRPMRACRLASSLGFEIEKKTFDAIKETLDVAAQISKERIHDEFLRLLKESPKPSVGIELMRKSGLLELYIPELLEGYGMHQNKYHVHDVYQHALDTVDIAPKEIRLAALFHDIGKSRTKHGEHFYGHDEVGAEMTREILIRLKFSKKFIEDTVNLIRWHMFFVPGSEGEKNQKSKTAQKKKSNKLYPGVKIKISEGHNHLVMKRHRKKTFKKGWSDAAIRRLIRRVGGHENIDKLIMLRIADATANPKSSFDPQEIRVLAERVAEVRQQESLMHTRDLKISGEDLMELGIPEGPVIKEILDRLLEIVTEKIELNNKEDLLRIVKKAIVKAPDKNNKINKVISKLIKHK